MARRQYSREFEISAVKLFDAPDYGVVKVSWSLGIDPPSFRTMAGYPKSEVKSFKSCEIMS